MNRRGFFGAFAAFAATATLDPERLLWVPGKKLISIPAPPRLMTVDQLLEEALRRLGYSRPLSPDQMTETFLEMSGMVHQQMLRPTPEYPLLACLHATGKASSWS